MDVAAFVGFAASGPVDIPVPITDAAQFREIFGEDLALAWDEDAGRIHRAYLGPAVRAFFRNGGRKCWVVRVADQAEGNRFLVPGLMSCTADGQFRHVLLHARSEGSWADPLRVGTQLEATPLPGAILEPDVAELTVRIPWSVRQRVHPGDLLQVEFQGHRAYLQAESVREAEIPKENQRPEMVWRVQGREVWFGRPALPEEGEVMVRYQSPRGDWKELTGYWAGQDSYENCQLYLPADLAPSPGAVLEIGAAGAPPFLLGVGKVRPATHDERKRLRADQPRALALVTGREPLQPLTPEEGRAQSRKSYLSASHLAFDLWVDNGSHSQHQMSRLGFIPRNPRFFGFLPDDAELFRRADDKGPAPDGPIPGEPIRQEAAGPRFPLAAPEPLRRADALFLPLGMDRIRRPGIAAGAIHTERPPLERNGLKEFTPSLFLDPDLHLVPPVDLGAVILHKRHMRQEQLRGIYAIWPLEEVTLLSAPDAVSQLWEAHESPSPPAPPQLLPPKITAGGLDLEWEAVDGVEAYFLEQGSDPEFQDDPVLYNAGTANSYRLPLPSTFEGYFRVRVDWGEGMGPWSNTRHVVVPVPDFRPVNQPVPPELKATSLGNGQFLLTWAPHGGSVRAQEYHLQAAHEPDFEHPVSMEMGRETSDTILWDGLTPVYYRVQARVGVHRSPWSNTVVLQQPRTVTWRLARPRPELEEAELHARAEAYAAGLRLALARGDLFVVLGMPDHYRAREAASFVRYLGGKLRQDGLRQSELMALSYGAVYHPWVRVREEDGRVHLVPPDGTVMGQIAQQTRERGAWAAPANRDLAGVVGLHHHIGLNTMAGLYAEHVNLIREDAGGFRLATALTLTQEKATRLIGVRRLLILLRRLLQREGARLLFAPNNQSFRQMAEMHVERLLSDLYMNGAFAGDTPDQAFQVATSPETAREEMEQGRLVIDVRVAPTTPLTFLVVRLSQGHDGSPLITEV